MARPFSQFSSLAIPLLRDNVDTDAIIPSREMTSVSKHGLAQGLFAGWRYVPGTRKPNLDFVLNDPRYRGAAILLSGSNFGCGSSREHAAWALAEYGIRAVVAPSFNPIFRSNCVRNDIIPIELDPAPLTALDGPLTINLEAQMVLAQDGIKWLFEIDPEVKAMLLGGLDEIDLTLAMANEISDFRARDRSARPWAYMLQVPQL